MGVAVLRHRDLLVEALELLRKTKRVNSHEEAELVAAYEQGSESVKQRVLELVDRLQRANFGEAIIQLHAEKESIRSDVIGASAALKAEGRALVDQSKKEIDAFLERNRPTVEAVERVSDSLSDAAKELAASLKYAGREAADELIKRGKTAIMGADTANLEQAVFDWSARTLPRIERVFTRILVGLGVLILLVGGLIGAVQFPAVRPFALVLFAVLTVGLGLYIVVQGLHIRNLLASQTRELERLAGMDVTERRQYLSSKFRKEPTSMTNAERPSPTLENSPPVDRGLSGRLSATMDK